jgi:hypothetical protein
MNEPTAPSFVHYYDTRLRTILCGLRGFEQRSTKHAHGVTCPACLGLLGKRSSPSPQVGTASSSSPAEGGD